MRVAWVIAMLFLGWISPPSMAQDTSQDIYEDSPFEVRSSLSWLNAGSGSHLLASPFNPGNFAAVPRAMGLTELRPELKLLGPRLIGLVRPRIRFSLSQARVSSDDRPVEGTLKFRWSEIFAQWDVTDAVSLVYGLQNYQWGPAESFSPSNRIFHDTAQVRDVLYDVAGKNLLRVNLSLNENWSTLAMLELAENGENSFVAEESFKVQGLIKTERKWNSGADYAGVVVGAKPGNTPWIGEYLSLSVSDAVSAYFDASQQRGSPAWYPATDPLTGIVALAKNHEQQSDVYTLAVAGARYAFENGADLRGEAIWNQAGYSIEERQRWVAAIESNWPAQLSVLSQNLSRASGLGLEYPGRSYLHLSVRVPDLFRKKDLLLYSRYLHSLQDHSGSAYLNLEYPVSDSGTVFGAGAVTHGAASGELRGWVSESVVLGYRHVW